MDSPYRQHLTVALSAIQTATSISRSVLSALRGSPIDEPLAPYAADLAVTKSDLSPVTVADLAIQTVVLQVLRTRFPTYGLLAEESSEQLRSDPRLLACVQGIVVAHARRSSFCWGEGGCSALEDPDAVLRILDRAGAVGHSHAQREEEAVWVVDPIDGTAAFLRGEQYAINVALVEGGRQVLSVVACPLLGADVVAGPVADATVDPLGLGSVAFAARGHGAYLLPLGVDVDLALAVSRAQRLPRYGDGIASKDQLRSVNAVRVDSGMRGVHEAVAARLGVDFPGSDLTGWVLRWVVLARGLANMTVWVYRRRDRFAKIWDHAGAMLLFEEVGGVITDIDGRPIDLSRGSLLDANFSFVAAPAQLHHVVLAETRLVLRRQGLEHLLCSEGQS